MKDIFNNIFEEEEAPQVCSVFADMGEDDNYIEEIKELNESTLPILALRYMVVFPGVAIPVAVGRKKSLSLVKAAQRKNLSIGVI